MVMELSCMRMETKFHHPKRMRVEPEAALGMDQVKKIDDTSSIYLFQPNKSHYTCIPTGPLNYTDPSLEMDGKWFLDQTVPTQGHDYEIAIEVRKGTRNATNFLQLKIVNGAPPLMEIV